MNRKQRRASGRGSSAPFPSPGGPPSAAALAELFGAAVSHHQAGAFAEAERRYRHILTLSPFHAETHGMLAVALFAQGRTLDAIPHFEQTAALRPDLAGPHDDLARAYKTAGKPELAIQAAARALELGETDRRKALFAQYVQAVVFTVNDPRFRRLVRRALVEAWARPRELGRVSTSLIKLDAAVNDAVAQANAAWPALLSPSELLGSAALTALSQDELLCRLLETDPIADLGLERLFANARYAMLASAAGDAPDEAPLDFFCALARQCFVNEYVYAMTEAEAEQAGKLRARLDAAIESAEPVSVLWPVAVGAYFPLHTLRNAQALLQRAWPASVKGLLAQQIEEPAREREIAAAIPALTGIDSEVSRAVRRQYEENPYPRWVKAGPSGQPDILRRQPLEQSFDVLFAGCGTGLSTTEFARHAHNARILAIDLSLASLSYAKRMSQNLGLTNIEFGHADITTLGAIGREFDFIDATGVLHHLADPWQGWRVLLSLLRPGGAMEVGLYSELARRHVVAARAMIAERRYRPIAEDIRRCREEIAAAEDGSLLHSLTRYNDFFTTSECRDLLFHPQEHRLTLPDIKAFLAANDLQFTGFVLPPVVLQRFAARFPERDAMTDLDCWHAFETDAPETFAGMYSFSVRKPAADKTGTKSG